MSEQKKQLLLQVDHLRSKEQEGAQEDICDELNPCFLELSEKDEIRASEPVTVKGIAYVTGEFLIVDIDFKAHLELPCSLCGEYFPYDIEKKHLITEVPLTEIKHGQYDVGEFLRETILLEIPFYPLCRGKACARRKDVEKYLKTKDDKHDGFQPFKNLSLFQNIDN